MAYIGDICEILDSRRIPITSSERKPGPYPYYGANGVQDYVADFIFDDELVLLAEDGGNFGSKEKPIAYRISGKCWVNNHAHVLKPKDGLDVNYLCYSLMFYDVSGLVNGATRQKLTQADMRKMKIPLPSIDDQRHIAALLDKVSDMIARHSALLDKLEELVKARFVEIFGDYRTNCNGFEQYKGSQLFQFSSGKFLPREKRYLSGVPVYGGNGIAWYTDVPLIDYDTIIIGRVGVQCGNIHMITEPAWVTDNAIFITKQKTNKLSLIFLSELMKMMDFHQYADFSGQPKITQKPLENMLYITPPMDIQNRFISFVKQTNKCKLIVQKSLDKLETLKRSLMQQYFG